MSEPQATYDGEVVNSTEGVELTHVIATLEAALGVPEQDNILSIVDVVHPPNWWDMQVAPRLRSAIEELRLLRAQPACPHVDQSVNDEGDA